MNEFYDEIEEKGIAHLLELFPFKEIYPVQMDRIVMAFRDIVGNNRKTMIDPDTDPDGFYSGRIVKMTLDKLGHTNYKINRHWEKRHGITEVEVNRAINEGYEYVIIVDSSTNSMELIKKLCAYGVRVLIFDHHQSDYQESDYPDMAIVVNSQHSVNRKPKARDDLSKSSACLLTAVICNKVLSSFGLEKDGEFYLYGYLTLYSDSCDLDSKFNLGVIQSVDKFAKHAKTNLTMFMTKWDAWNRSFVEFGLVPKLNALVRTEQFDVLFRYFYEWDELSHNERQQLVVYMQDNYKATKELTQELAKNTRIEEYPTFIIGYMDDAVAEMSITYSRARNFTGVVASKIMNEYNKATVVVVSVNADTYQGSVRDPFNRDLLKMVKQLTKAGGHAAAFGIEVPKLSIGMFINNLKRFKEYFTLTKDNTILIDGNMDVDIFRQMNIMAEYNEVSGNDVPVCYVTKRITGDMKINRHDNYTTVMWQGKRVTVFSTEVDYQDVLVIKPTMGNNEVKYLVNTIVANNPVGKG